ncbi:biotin-dependent carboxyltransferase family protein [Marinobacter sp. 1Y8]
MTDQPQGLIVRKPGFLSLIQDAGRTRVMHLGLASGGAMDRHAWAWGNHLLGNTYGTPALEITFGGCELTCTLETRITVTGAAVTCTVNGEAQPLWATLSVHPGDEIALSAPQSGLRAYLAVLGGFQVAPGLGDSCATFTREGTGGLHHNGKPLQTGDVLPCAALTNEIPSRKVPDQWVPDYDAETTLDVILGAQVDRFPARSLDVFFSQPYELSPQSDRMGARLKGPALNINGERLISEGISLGAIQVPADGQPIILLNDRQTIGGYPKLGAVTPRSLDALAQCVPGSPLTFRPITLHEAQLQEQTFLHFFR